uniref:Uncharacterized protein n=1 Tax=Ditylenchus dipsaci TaxID=166011 RepID=A0A915ES77_9BILA
MEVYIYQLSSKSAHNSAVLVCNDHSWSRYNCASGHKICVYLLNSCGDRLISILMEQLTNVGEPFKLQLFRCEMPPFYRWVQQPSPLANSSECSEEDEKIGDKNGRKAGQKSRKNLQLQTNAPCRASPCNTTPKQLPMPPYGGHYARLLTLLPPSTQVVPSFTRNNLTLFLLPDLIGQT